MTTADVPTRMEVNCTTGEVSIIPLTLDEIAERDALAAAFAAEQEAQAAAETTRLARIASGKAKLVAGTPLLPEETEALWPTP